jgi:aspartyl-tRNA(Asn)/glutamyl-tRNA(Gln) amidotransferase subunit A
LNATLTELASELAQSRVSSRALVERCLDAIRDPRGEGARTFLSVDAERSLASAELCDQRRSHGATGRFAGIPISIKDLFDVEGQITRAGSILLRTAPPARADAPAVARLRRAGFIPVGRTNMTEFAFSGLGLNVHYGTPANPHDPAVPRIPGGSSSGAGVSVAAGMAYVGLGTDTGGSCRIPAAFCGVVGFKPTARRIPLRGAFPLAPSLDSVGPLANSVECCAIVDAVLAGEIYVPLPPLALRGLRLAVPQSYVLEDLDQKVATAFARTLHRLSAYGAVIEEILLPELRELSQFNQRGGIAPPEAYAIHRDWIEQQRSAYDPRVLTRILRGKEQDAADYIRLMQTRAEFSERINRVIGDFYAVLLPTVPIVAPSIEALADDREYLRVNSLVLRNPSVINFIDGCAISIPCHAPGELPVGLMMAAPHGQDRRLLATAAAIERVVSEARDENGL